MTTLPEHIVLTDDERLEFEAKAQVLYAAGYVDIAEHGDLRVGARIRHRGHQWHEAFHAGTGYVAALTEKPDSAWSWTYGKPDIELIAVWDTPRSLAGSSRMSQLAQYHVYVIEVPDAS